MRYTVLTILMTFLLVACNMISPSRKPAQYSSTNKELVLVRVPPKTINRELSKIAQNSDIIKRIGPLSMDPVTRIISLRMTIKYPLNSLFNYEQKPKYQLAEEQDIEMAFSLPELVMSKYLSITFHKFKINGDDYINAFSIVGAVVQTVLTNSSLINYVFDSAGTSMTDYRAMMTDIIEDNGILVNQTMRNIKFKLNLNYFDQLADYTQDFKDLRVWSLEPALFHDQDVFFQIIAGIGRPGREWKEKYFTERNQDIEKILKIRNALYDEYSNISSVNSILISYLERILAKESIQYSKIDQIYKNDIDRFKGTFAQSARDILTTNKQTFEADPEAEYFSFISDQKEKIKNFVSDLDRRLTIDQNILAKGSYLKTKPLITKRIGLDVLNASMNYLRDYEYDGQYYVKDAYISIAPQVPGLIARGKINIDLKYLLGQMDKNLISKNVISKIPETKTGIPFEMVLETKFEDNTILGLDAKSITMFEGEKKLHFTRNSRNQDFMLDFIKVYLVESFAAYGYDIGGESNLTPEQQQAKKFKELINYLKALKVAYKDHTDSGILKNILKVLETDITKNPHATAGEQYLKNKQKILFGDVMYFDQKDGLFKLRLDPKIVMDNIMGAQNTLQVWNVAPLYSREFNNTFLEVAVGSGVRSKKYVEETFDLRNDLDNANFVGIYNDNNRSTVDMLASLNFKYVETYANNLFKSIVQKKNGTYKKELEKDEEQTHYILDHIKLDIRDQKKIFLDLNASVLKKKKGGLFGWGKWKTDKKSYAISAEIELESKSLDEVKYQLNSHRVPIYLTDQLIGIKLNRVRLKFGKRSFVNNALNKLTNLNLTGSIGSKFRKLLLKIVNTYFQSTWKKKDDNNMFGDSLEEMVRVFTTKDQIMLMLNPRMGGSAFELKLTGQERNFATKAIKVDSKNQELHVAFTAATAMAKIDRRELLNIVQDTNELFNDYLKIKNKNQFLKELNTFQLVNKGILNSDEEKMSLYNRLIKVMRNYDQVLQVTNIPFKAKNTDRRITSCGNELLYFSAVSYILYNRLYKVTKKIRDWKLESKVKYYDKMVEARKKLFSNIFKPLLLKYRDKFHNRNKDILNAPHSYWTHSFYPDAFFSEAVYKELLKEGI